MFEEINAELEQLRLDVAHSQKTESMLRDLNGQLAYRRKRESDLEEKLEKENLDYEKAGRMSLSALFYTVLGNREERVEKERQEALAAKLKLDQCRYEIQGIEARIAELEKGREKLRGCGQKYDALLREKQQMIFEKHGKSADRIIALQNELLSCSAKGKEIDEAISAGKDVLNAANRVVNNLDDAEVWGTWDLLGGGLISTMAKHSRIDDAKDAAADVSRLLDRFHSELADVRILPDLDIEIDGFSKFADYFFDGLIADWAVQNKIRHSLGSAEQLKDQVDSVLEKLKEFKRRNEETTAGLNVQITETVRTADT